jgi:hypothetical protein
MLDQMVLHSSIESTTESLAPPAIDDIPVGHCVPPLEFNHCSDPGERKENAAGLPLTVLLALDVLLPRPPGNLRG